jgi:hypothetical protein
LNGVSDRARDYEYVRIANVGGQNRKLAKAYRPGSLLNTSRGEARQPAVPSIEDLELAVGPYMQMNWEPELARSVANSSERPDRAPRQVEYPYVWRRSIDDVHVAMSKSQVADIG